VVTSHILRFVAGDKQYFDTAKSFVGLKPGRRGDQTRDHSVTPRTLACAAGFNPFFDHAFYVQSAANCCRFSSWARTLPLAMS
jgi:hypothetical protein